MQARLDPIAFPFELVRKYNRPGPRYTSYPTAPHFTEAFGPEAYAEALRTREAGPGGLSLYVHLPFCRSLCYYCGCHMMVTQRPEKIEQYLQYLLREIDLFVETAAPEGRAVQLHWGGGTPTYLEPEQIERLSRHLHERFDVAPGAEVSIEADPRGLTRAHLEAARRAGFNRISFGVQDFDAEVQEAIHRVQPYDLVARSTEWARELGFEGVSYDLIYGLPHQSVERFAATVDQVVALQPDRVSIFSYAHVPWLKRHQRVIDTQVLPQAEEKLRILLMTARRLVDEGGYRFIGMDHFARPDDALVASQEAGTMQRNFQGYSTHAESALFGFGISAISQMETVYAQNEKELKPYYDALDAGRLPTQRGYRLTTDDRLRRDVIMQIMSHFRLDVPAVEAAYEIDFHDYFAEALKDLDELEADGLIVRTPTSLQVTPVGRMLVRNVAMPFDRYLREAAARSTPTYSKTI